MQFCFHIGGLGPPSSVEEGLKRVALCHIVLWEFSFEMPRHRWKRRF